MAARHRIPTINDILAPGGSLSRELSAYEHRSEQQDACSAIEEAFLNGTHCLVEAGTGVGKSLAYLIPAVRAAARGKHTVVSTHTISLQAQLIEKDIPLVQRLFPGIAIKSVVMKGRSNYLCLQDLDAAEADLFNAMDPMFKEIKQWAGNTANGDSAELPFSFPNWYEIAANQDTCRNKECGYYDRCFYYKMRQNAANADIIVVNHALYLSDLAIRHVEPQSAIIPNHDFVVFDEAHHLEDVATKVFGLEFGNKRLPYFLERVRRTRGVDIDLERINAVEELNQRLFNSFSSNRAEFFFEDALDNRGQEQIVEVTNDICERLDFIEKDLLDRAKDAEGALKERLQGMSRIGARLREELATLVFRGDDPSYIRWGDRVDSRGRYEGRSHGGARHEPKTTLYYTPIEVGKLMRDMLWSSVESAVLTSATLANSGGFSYLRSRLAIPDDVIERVIGSPFDYKMQALLYVPGHLPEPPKSSDDNYIAILADEIERIVNLSKGRAFLLFTSRRMLNAVYGLLAPRLEYPLFKQGDMPPGLLVDAFKQSLNGCLFGTQTFWEGVDVQGDSLSCVIIDRLPFAVPDSPVTRARTNAIAESGGDWFNEYSVPQAQLRLKQGFGRLIRTKTDRGLVCILDSRLIHKRYGKEFVKFLPPASRASLWPRVERFWHEANKEEPQKC